MASEKQLKHLGQALEERVLPTPPKRSFLQISDLKPKEIAVILERGLETKTNPEEVEDELGGVRVALLFQKKSTRTRCSFEIGIWEMGGWPMYIDWSVSNFSRADLKDEIKVLSRYFDLIVARVNDHSDLEIMREFSEMPIINGLSDLHHPCQGLTDYMTMQEYFGSLAGLHVVYLGDGNNTCHSLMEGASLTGATMTVCHPIGYAPDETILKRTAQLTEIRLTSDPIEAVKNADVIYTDTWVSMGDEVEQEIRLKVFPPYQLNEALLAKAPKHALIMHCLPAHRGEEISSGALDSKNSVVFDQAENRKHLQKALMGFLLEE
jgi:ornithine carbamoyltransferase